MSRRRPGRLIIVGGHEAKDGDRSRTILEEIARRGERERGHLLIVTVATQHPEAVAAEYTRLFRELGVRELEVLDIREREDARSEAASDASVVFFTGGDQLRITSQVGDRSVFRCMLERYEQGLTIAATSAGAAAMPATMIVVGPGDTSNEISALAMAPGLGLIDGGGDRQPLRRAGPLRTAAGRRGAEPAQPRPGLSKRTRRSSSRGATASG